MARSGIRRTFGVPEVDEETRQAALQEPGPSWREWFFFEFLKIWILLALLILNVWIAVLWLEPVNVAGLVVSLALAFYGEFLFYRFLWYRPNPDRETREFRPTFLRPTRFGRWTPEAWRFRAGADPFAGASTGPDPREFL